ncbi:MAG: serine protease [Myxococcota bacterium]|nr:serine protease [Myxococcota bacterium]
MDSTWLLRVALPLMIGSLPGAAHAADPDAVDAWLDSVVLLVTGSAYCSGVVVDESGLVATAYHCVSNGKKTHAWTRPDPPVDDEERPDVHTGRMVAAAPKDDLALVSIPGLAGRVAPMPIRAEPPRPGSAAYGLGHPFAPAAETSDAMEGMLLWSVTGGIVSAVGPKLIQTDAALNPGNSGGPVVDDEGRIIGITSRKLQADNIAFAASAERLTALMAEPTPPRLLGGDVALGLSWLGGSMLFGPDSRSFAVDSALELLGRVTLRDRLVLGVGAGISSAGRMRALEQGVAYAPALEASAAVRQRFGRGRWSTTLEVGGGAWVVDGLSSRFDAETGSWTVFAAPPQAGPGAMARIGVGGVGLRTVAVLDDPEDPLWLLGFDLEVPGVLATF